MSPQAHALAQTLIRSTLKSLAQLFQLPSESSGSCFHLFESRSSSESRLITKAVCCDIFESFCNGGKQKSRDELYADKLNRTLLCICPSSHGPFYHTKNCKWFQRLRHHVIVRARE